MKARLPNKGDIMRFLNVHMLFRGYSTRCATGNYFPCNRPLALSLSNLVHEAHRVNSSFLTKVPGHGHRCFRTGSAACRQAWHRTSALSVVGLPPSRGYSSDGGDGQDRRLEELKGIIMYIPNPSSWLRMQWQMLQLRRKYDPSFSMPEFLSGAKQALCRVTNILSREDFDDLENLVSHQVAVWLKGHISTWSVNEKESISLAPEEIVVMKARGSKLVEMEEEKILYIDTICFALKRDMQNMKPLLIDIGFRFMRNYGTQPPSDWVIGGVSHLRFQLLSG